MPLSFSPLGHETNSRSGIATAAAIVWAACTATAAAGLDDPVRASWTAVPLRDWAARAATLAGMPVVVDRRLDPGTAVTLACRGEPLRDVLGTAAGQADAEVALLRSSIRIVPRGQRDLCQRAEAARDRELARLPAAGRAALTNREPWHWPEAARPRDLVAAVVADAGLALEGVDALPHDHFPAADLPALSRAERIDLVLAHFDRRARWRPVAGRVQGVIVPLDTDLPPSRAAMTPARPQPAAATREVFSLRVAAPLDELLATVADRLGLALELDRDSLQARGIAPREIVRADIRDASRDELLDRIVAPLSLAWRIDAGRLQVFAPPSPGQSP